MYFTLLQLAESVGLLHISSGDGDNRHISIKKPLKLDQSCKTTGQKPGQENQQQQPQKTWPEDNQKGVNDKKSQRTENIQNISSNGNSSNESQIKQQRTNHLDEPEEEKTIDDSNAICDKCHKTIPATNIELHKFRCNKDATSPVRATEDTKDRVQSGKKSKKQKGGKTKSGSAKSKVATKENVEEDFDALIAEAMQQNNVCNYRKCKNYTTTLGQNCGFCAKRFCLTHHIPEVHGCGAEAKAQARAVINREGVLYRGSGVPDKKVDPVKREYLQKKLEKKVEQMADKRKIKKKE